MFTRRSYEKAEIRAMISKESSKRYVEDVELRSQIQDLQKRIEVLEKAAKKSKRKNPFGRFKRR